MEGSKIMGILDDVTHAGDEPEVSGNVVEEPRFLTITEEENATIKEWLNAALDEEKEVVVDGNVTKTFYSHARVPVRTIFQDVRQKIKEADNREGNVFITKYYTTLISSSEAADYLNDICLSDGSEDAAPNTYFAMVLDGNLNSSIFPANTFEKNSGYFVVPDPKNETISHSGDEDLLLLCFSLT
jgi:hypothetical protein